MALITARDAAEKCGISKSAIHKAIQRGTLKSTLVLGRIAIEESELKRWRNTDTVRLISPVCRKNKQ